MAIAPTKNFMAKPVIYVKWPTVYFLCFKFELNRSINKSKSAIYSFFLFIVTAAILEKGRDRQPKFLLVTNQGPSKPNLIQIGLVVSEKKIFKESDI